MGEWLTQHGLELALAIVSGAWFVSRTLVNFGEWKHGVTSKTSDVDTATIDRLRLEIVEAARKARHDAVEAMNTTLIKLDKRLDQASEQSSRLASRVQGLPTRDDYDGIWNELRHTRTAIEDMQRSRGDLGERIARIEGRA